MNGCAYGISFAPHTGHLLDVFSSGLFQDALFFKTSWAYFAIIGLDAGTLSISKSIIGGTVAQSIKQVFNSLINS